MTERNSPEVVAGVAECFTAYEHALATGDLDEMAAAFEDSPEVVRYGIADRQRGSEELAAFRKRQGRLPPGRTLSETTITTFGSDAAIVATLFTYPGRPVIGRQSQTWIRIDGAWKIVHAHVSEVPASLGDRT
ncbi:MAG TPA: AtzH-like domain-containing protein [Acidimicrobiales bacterium]|nr:AtzH-like domain-containing protein [Acidimicrobiales bacterium]